MQMSLWEVSNKSLCSRTKKRTPYEFRCFSHISSHHHWNEGEGTASRTNEWKSMVLTTKLIALLCCFYYFRSWIAELVKTSSLPNTHFAAYPTSDFILTIKYKLYRSLSRRSLAKLSKIFKFFHFFRQTSCVDKASAKTPKCAFEYFCRFRSNQLDWRSYEVARHNMRLSFRWKIFALRRLPNAKEETFAADNPEAMNSQLSDSWFDRKISVNGWWICLARYHFPSSPWYT